MADRDRGRGLLNRSRREFAVSFIGYVVGFIVILFVLNRVSMIQRQPQQALVLAVVVPLVPFLILLAHSGRIEAIKALGVLEITFDEAVHKSEREGSQPSSDRRTVLKLGAIVVAIGAIWHFVLQEAGFNGLLSDGGDGTDLGDGDSQTDPQTDTPINTMTETANSPSQVEYGEQA